MVGMVSPASEFAAGVARAMLSRARWLLMVRLCSFDPLRGSPRITRDRDLLIPTFPLSGQSSALNLRSTQVPIFYGTGKGILETLKSHGCVITDGGTSVSFYLEVADTWGTNMVKFAAVSPIAVNSTNFDIVAVDRSAIYSDSAGGLPPYTAAPTISSFIASPGGTVAAGAAVKLSWSVSGATAIRYLYPEVGPLRGPAEPGMAASGYDLTGFVAH